MSSRQTRIERLRAAGKTITREEIRRRRELREARQHEEERRRREQESADKLERVFEWAKKEGLL
jgi:hypothetical protein